MVERLPIPSLETKQEKLVIVRGRVQTKAFVESEGDQRDAEALIPLNVPEKAVFVERTQTVCCDFQKALFVLCLSYLL